MEEGEVKKSFPEKQCVGKRQQSTCLSTFMYSTICTESMPANKPTVLESRDRKMKEYSHNATLGLLKNLLKNHCSLWNLLRYHGKHDICLRKVVSKKSMLEIFRNDSNYVRQAKRKAIQGKTSALPRLRLFPIGAFVV